MADKGKAIRTYRDPRKTHFVLSLTVINLHTFKTSVWQ